MHDQHHTMGANIDALAAQDVREPEWVRATRVPELRMRGRLVFRHGRKQIVLFSTAHGFFACNNRCPHEGYPLIEGTLGSHCELTCNWHNWKFDLRSGDNLYGGDRLRTYPLEVRGEEIWIDVAQLPCTERHAQARRNLEQAFRDNDYERMARELARWSALRADPLGVLRAAVEWSWDRMEFGWTHAFAGMADWLALYDEHDEHEVQLVCILESLGHVANDVHRESRYPFTSEVSAYDSVAFAAAIEAEDEPAAVAMVRGGFRDAIDLELLERDLSRAALAHYNDFGHSLIYVSKLERLIGRLGAPAAEQLVMALVRSLVYATREDLIPEFRGYAKALSRWGSGNAELTVASLRSGGIDGALTAAAAASDHDPAELYRTLLAANAENLLTFDADRAVRVKVPVSQNVGWLDFTHGITFANAVRRQCTKYPELWPQGLLQMACFAGRNAPFARQAPDLAEWRARDPARFLADTLDRVLDHGLGEFIVSVHWLKTVLAVRDELASGVAEPLAEQLLAGLNRFLSSPLKRRHVGRTVYQACQFVARE